MGTCAWTPPHCPGVHGKARSGWAWVDSLTHHGTAHGKIPLAPTAPKENFDIKIIKLEFKIQEFGNTGGVGGPNPPPTMHSPAILVNDGWGGFGGDPRGRPRRSRYCSVEFSASASATARIPEAVSGRLPEQGRVAQLFASNGVERCARRLPLGRCLCVGVYWQVSLKTSR